MQTAPYDGIAEAYARARTSYYRTHPNPSSALLEEILRWTIRGKRVLDAGCGTGGDLAFLLRKGAEVYGIDPSPEMLRIAERAHPAARLSCQSMERLTFADAFFDVIVSKYALNYVPDVDAALRELRRVLKPGGTMVLVVSHPAAELYGKESATYGDGTPARLSLWHGAMEAVSWGHSLDTYLSAAIRQDLRIQRFTEGPAAQARPDVAWHVPFFFCLVLRKTPSWFRKWLHALTGKEAD